MDPADDLPSVDYTGDFETTRIPSYDVASSSIVGADNGASGGEHPLPYAQQGMAGRGAGDPAVGYDTSGTGGSATSSADRRGTQDLGLFVLRLGLGAVLIAHGLQKAFGWWGGQGLAHFRSSLTEAGYQHADILTYAGAGGQIAAGALLVLGLFTPVAAAGALAYLINGVLTGVSEQSGDRLSYFLPGGHEYQIMMVVVAVAIVLAGPGRYALDGDRGWARRPFIGSFVALLLGIGGGVAMWVFLNGANPLG